ncbi:MAG: hypothetical protein QHI48_07960 [Bacteroidota bacterium]|nr:hypothetical protein [Bacteroidota bacterium]
MVISAMYRGREYLLYTDSTKKELIPSRFEYTIVAPPTNIIPYSFEEGGEYPINTPFEFYTDRCGNCGRKENIKNVPFNEIFVTVEDRNGNDLLARDRDVEKYNEPATPPFENGVRVRFFLNPKAKIPRDGMDAVIRIRSGPASEDFNIRLFPVK